MSLGRYILFFVAFWQSSSSFEKKHYCSFASEHTLCKDYKDCGTGYTVIRQGVSKGDAVNILHLHNQLRSKVASGNETRGRPGPQPPASNMKIMEWDEELARIAQGHANQCIFAHECSQCRRVSRFDVGQNLYQTSQSNAKVINKTNDWTGAITAWYDEVDDFNPSRVYPFIFSEALGNYTAMMWDNTYKIGCGYIMFEEKIWWKSRKLWKKLYVCNYGPAGNLMFNEMYKAGNPCSACSEACSNKYAGLCDNNHQNLMRRNSFWGSVVGSFLATSNNRHHHHDPHDYGGSVYYNGGGSDYYNGGGSDYYNDGGSDYYNDGGSDYYNDYY